MRDDYETLINERFGHLEDRINNYNEAVISLRSAHDECQEAIVKVREWVENIASDRRDKFDEKSEKWLESEAGDAASEWLEAWESFEIEDIELEIPSEIELPDLSFPELPE
jgi:oligoendopeptidase F